LIYIIYKIFLKMSNLYTLHLTSSLKDPKFKLSLVIQGEKDFLFFLEEKLPDLYFLIEPFGFFSFSFLSLENCSNQVIDKILITSCSSQGFCNSHTCFLCGNLYEKWKERKEKETKKEEKLIIQYLTDLEIQKKYGLCFDEEKKEICFSSIEEAQPLIVEKEIIYIYLFGASIEVPLNVKIERCNFFFQISKKDIYFLNLTEKERNYLSRIISSPKDLLLHTSEIEDILSSLYLLSLPSDSIRGLKEIGGFTFLSKNSKYHTREVRLTLSDKFSSLIQEKEWNRFLKRLPSANSYFFLCSF